MAQPPITKADLIFSFATKLVGRVKLEIKCLEETGRVGPPLINMGHKLLADFGQVFDTKELTCTFVEHVLLQYWKNGKFDRTTLTARQDEEIKKQLIAGDLEEGQITEELQARMRSQFEFIFEYFTAMCDVYTN